MRLSPALAFYLVLVTGPSWGRFGGEQSVSGGVVVSALAFFPSSKACIPSLGDLLDPPCFEEEVFPLAKRELGVF